MHDHDVRRTSKTAAHRISTVFFAAALTAFGVAGCGGGSNGTSTVNNGPPAATAASGSALVTLTDAPGDFLSYLVNVVSLQLTRADGTVVQTVPTTTQVDFAQLVNLSEVVSAQQIPSGHYVSAALTVDYANATLVVDSGAGGLTVSASNILNGSTNAALVAPNSTITVSLQLPTNNELVVTPGSIANLALDFNLSASNAVAPAAISAATAASSVTVTVNPVLTASLVPDTSKPLRVRGPLVSVTNTSAATSYTVNVRPFFNNAGDQGTLVVNTTSTTSFSIDGAVATGTAGLTALAGLAAGTMTSATGSFDVATKTFTATSVTVNSNAAGVDFDTVEGLVTARSGNTLTVSNGLCDPRWMNVAKFQSQTTVTIASTTAVTEAGQSGSFVPQDISVGQHARFYGTLSTAASGNLAMDASTGNVELRPTALVGTVLSSTASSVTVNLQSLDGLAASAFTFAGTGATTAQDATAASYVVSVPASLLSTPVVAGAVIKLVGFAAPFGTAPPDFTAVSLVNYANTAALLDVEWALPGVTAPFTAPLSATNVALSQTTLQSAAEHRVRVGPEVIDPSTASTGISLTADASAANPAFSIGHAKSHKIDTFGAFSDLITALNTDLNGTTALLVIGARGPYDTSTGVLSVDQMVVLLND